LFSKEEITGKNGDDSGDGDGDDNGDDNGDGAFLMK
jgi:hypothetical protein